MTNWKLWLIWGGIAAWVLLVVVMFASDEAARLIGWITPIGLLFLAGFGVFIAAAVKFLRQKTD